MYNQWAMERDQKFNKKQDLHLQMQDSKLKRKSYLEMHCEQHSLHSSMHALDARKSIITGCGTAVSRSSPWLQMPTGPS